MLRKINDQESILIKDDPVRPQFSYEWRTCNGREVWVWENPITHVVDAVICMAFTNDVPTDELELEVLSNAAASRNEPATHAVFYTVWSYASGAGRTLVNELAQYIYNECENITRWITLSPLTEMAERFHLSNGATLLKRNATSQNFEYTDRILSQPRISHQQVIK